MLYTHARVRVCLYLIRRARSDNSFESWHFKYCIVYFISVVVPKRLFGCNDDDNKLIVRVSLEWGGGVFLLGEGERR